MTIRPSVDTGRTTFTLVLPRVVLPSGAPIMVHTIGIITAHRHSPIPAMDVGQLQTYRTVALSGMASAVESLAGPRPGVSS